MLRCISRRAAKETPFRKTKQNEKKRQLIIQENTNTTETENK